jgi:hypothetical protein
MFRVEGWESRVGDSEINVEYLQIRLEGEGFGDHGGDSC